MKSYFYGLIINFQFFSMIPIRKEVPMTSKNMERMIRTLPLFGLMLGLFYSGIAYLFAEGAILSSLMITFVLWLLSIVLTGGIHLDGWIDTNDAFFSYRDREKRLEIMNDPQTGAFGVISAIVLLTAKFLFIYEVMLQLETLSYILILFIPFFTRMLAGMMLVVVPTAKKDGLGSMFQKAAKRGTLGFYAVYMIPAGICLWLWGHAVLLMVIVMFLSMLLIFLFLRRKVYQWFGGITGDVVGASLEGMEVCLWMIVWLLHYFVMG